MNLLSLLLLACSGPDPMAQKACEAVPTLSADAARLAEFEPLLLPSELDAMRSAEPIAGMAEHAALLPEIRSKAVCTIRESKSLMGTDMWTIHLTATYPRVELDGTLGEPVDHDLEWMAHSSEGMKLDIGLAKAASRRQSAMEAAAEGDWKRATGNWRSIATKVPDPFLAFEIAASEKRELGQQVLGRLQAAFDRVEGGDVVARVGNPTEHHLASVKVGYRFVSDGQVLGQVSADSGPIAPGAEIEVRGKIPFEVDGVVVVGLLDVEVAKP